MRRKVVIAQSPDLLPILRVGKLGHVVLHHAVDDGDLRPVKSSLRQLIR
jgi:hypothetical protein